MESEEEAYLLSETIINASRNNFSQYLYDIYDKKIRFRISNEDVVNIETGIASMVQYIANCAKEQCRCDPLQCSFRQRFPGMTLRRSWKRDVIKVGSFYENTKTGFPDEFDFLFPVFAFKSDLQYDIKKRHESCMYCMRPFKGLHDCMSPFQEFHDAVFNCSKTMKEKLNYQLDNKTILFKGYVRRRGPSSKLRFSYQANKRETVIYVDLVPCLKITFPQSLKFGKLPLLCKGFERHVLSTGSYVIVGCSYKVSFAETEVRFMKEVLSEKHRKVYMLLKVLINGHDDNEALRTEFDTKGLCSYYIKCAMIYHHFECDSQNDIDEAGCVMTVLRKLKSDLEKYENRVKLLTHVKYVEYDTTKALAQLLERLEEMHKSENVRKLSVVSAAKTQFNIKVKDRRDERVHCCISCFLSAVEKCCEVGVCKSVLACIYIFGGVIVVAGILYFLITFLEIFTSE